MSRFAKYVQQDPAAAEPTTQSRFAKYLQPTDPTTPDTPQEEPGFLGSLLGKVPQPVKTTVGTVFDILGRPGAATAGTIAGALSDAPGVEGSALQRGWENLAGRRRDDFDQVLEERGYEAGLGRTLTGLAGDVVVDPLNLLAVGAVRHAVGAPLKAAGAATGKALKTADQAAGGFGKRVMDDLGEKFVPRYGLQVGDKEAATLAKVGKHVNDPKAVKDDFHRFQKERGTIEPRTEHKVIDQFKEFPDADTRKVLSDEVHAGAGSTTKTDEFVQAYKKQQDDLHKLEVDNLVQKPESFNPDYGAYYDFTKAKGGQVGKDLKPSSAISAKLGPAKHRKLEDWETAKAAGAEQDLAVATYHRLVKSEKAILSSKFAREQAAKHGIHVDELTKLDPTDIASFRKLEKFPAEEPLRKHLEEFVFPEKIAKALEAQFTPAGEPGVLGKIYEKALRGWRAQATVLRPGFHGTNLQGNIFNAWLGGQVNPGRYVESIAWAAGKGPAKIGNYSADEIAEFMARYGVGGADHNFVSEMIQVGAESQLTRRLSGVQNTTMGAVKDAAKHPLQTARMVGSGIEDTSKRALFFDGLHHGMSLEDAAKNVDKFLFDYADLTTFEKNVMRKIFPFYTWMRKNTPLQVENVVTQPHKYAGVEKVRHSIEKNAEDDPRYIDPAFRPDYMQEAGAVQIPRSVARMMGTPEESVAMWTPYLPFQDLNNIPIPGGMDAMESARNIGGGINPVLKGVIELLANRSLFTNSPVYDSELGPFEDTQKITDSMDLLTRQVPGLQDALFTPVRQRDGSVAYETPAITRYLAQQLPVAEAIGKSAQSVTRPEDASNPKAWLGQLTGVRVTEQGPDQQRARRKAAKSEAKRVAAKLKKQQPVKKTDLDSLYASYLQQ